MAPTPGSKPLRGLKVEHFKIWGPYEIIPNIRGRQLKNRYGWNRNFKHLKRQNDDAFGAPFWRRSHRNESEIPVLFYIQKIKIFIEKNVPTTTITTFPPIISLLLSCSRKLSLEKTLSPLTFSPFLFWIWLSDLRSFGSAMSMSDLDFSSNAGEYKNFRQINRDRKFIWLFLFGFWLLYLCCLYFFAKKTDEKIGKWWRKAFLFSFPFLSRNHILWHKWVSYLLLRWKFWKGCGHMAFSKSVRGRMFLRVGGYWKSWEKFVRFQ